jgi:hypothetical protein
MAEQIFDLAIAAMQYLMAIGFAVLAVFLFWHFRRINRPITAFIFWCIMFLTSLVPMFELFQSGIPLGNIPIWYIAVISLLPLATICAYLVNPLATKRYDYENDEI